MRLEFNHPVKELVWVVQPETFTTNAFTQPRGGHQWFNYTDYWDYSGFSGTPSGYYGNGMKGGRSQNNIFEGYVSCLNVLERKTTDKSVAFGGSFLHQDTSYLDKDRPRYTMLMSIEVPDDQGNTIFSSGFNSYNKLPEQIKEKIKLPILCKDFFIDKFQIPLAKSYGADAILIILAGVKENLAHELYNCLLYTSDAADE